MFRLLKAIKSFILGSNQDNSSKPFKNLDQMHDNQHKYGPITTPSIPLSKKIDDVGPTTNLGRSSKAQSPEYIYGPKKPGNVWQAKDDVGPTTNLGRSSNAQNQTNTTDERKNVYRRIDDI